MLVLSPSFQIESTSNSTAFQLSLDPWPWRNLLCVMLWLGNSFGLGVDYANFNSNMRGGDPVRLLTMEERQQTHLLHTASKNFRREVGK